MRSLHLVTILPLLLLGLSAAWAQAPVVDPAPWIRHTIDASSRGADGVRLADVNDDGWPDVVTGWEEGGVVRVYFNPGPARAASPWPAVTVGEVASVEDAVFVDLDGDGALDVVSAAEGDLRSLFVHWAPHPETYGQPQVWQTEPIPAAEGRMQWMFTLPMQVDGRHGVDLVAGGKNQGAEVGWWEAPPAPRDLAAGRWHPLSPAGWIMSLLSADMDGDGDPDLVLSDRRGPLRGLRWLEHPGSDALGAAWVNNFIGGRDHEVMFMTLADLDGDAREDVLSAVRGDRLLLFRRRPGPGVTWDPYVIPLPDGTGTAKAVAVGDLDGDGRAEIVFSCENARDGRSGVMSLSRTGADLEAWQAHEISGPAGTKFDLVHLVDLDRDGDLDVLSCEETEGLGVFWYENPN